MPRNYEEARNSVKWREWKQAMENELESLDKHEVWDVCVYI